MADDLFEGKFLGRYEAWMKRMGGMVDHVVGNALVRLGDKAGAKKLSLRNSDDTEVASVNSMGQIVGKDLSIAGPLTVTDGPLIVGSGAVIVAGDQLNQEKWRSIRLSNSWANFGSGYNEPGYCRLPYDRVLLGGMIKSGSLNAVAFAMSGAYMSEADTILPTISNNGAVIVSRITVDDTNISPTVGGNTWFTLDGNMLRAGRWPWVVPTLQGAWVDYGGVWSTAGHIKDADGLVFLKGMVKSGSTGTNCIVLPSDSWPVNGQIFFAVCSIAGTLTICRIDVSVTGGVNLQPGAGSLDWVSLERVRFPTDVSDWTIPTLTNSWVVYSGAWLGPMYWKDDAGVVHLAGLIKDGTIGAAAFTLPVGYRPRQHAVVGAISNNAGTLTPSQVSINSASGTVTLATGGNTWFSLSGICFRAEQ